ncbi:31374_t:CDS:1, partial [Racocetra persica]
VLFLPPKPYGIVFTTNKYTGRNTTTKKDDIELINESLLNKNES